MTTATAVSQTSGKPATILLADDDPDDRDLTRDAWRDAGRDIDFRAVGDGEELMAYLRHQAPYGCAKSAPRPQLILLDLNMPRIDGREALALIKQDAELRRIPTVVLTTSKADGDIRHSYDLGVNAFITKPASYRELVRIMELIGNFWLETVELP